MKKLFVFLAVAMVLLASYPVLSQDKNDVQRSQQKARNAYLQGYADAKLGQIAEPQDPEARMRYLQGVSDALQEAQKQKIIQLRQMDEEFNRTFDSHSHQKNE